MLETPSLGAKKRGDEVPVRLHDASIFNPAGGPPISDRRHHCANVVMARGWSVRRGGLTQRRGER